MLKWVEKKTMLLKGGWEGAAPLGPSFNFQLLIINYSMFWLACKQKSIFNIYLLEYPRFFTHLYITLIS